MPSDARIAKLPLPSHHSNPGFRTDSSQTHPSCGTQTRHRFTTTDAPPTPIATARRAPRVLAEVRSRAHDRPDVRALCRLRAVRSVRLDADALEASGGRGGVGAGRHRREPP